MSMLWTRRFIVGATLLHGVLAGVNVDRILMGLPAWHQRGVVAWANYSRPADLGNGLVIYPVLAIGGALFSLAATVSIRSSGTVPVESHRLDD